MESNTDSSHDPINDVFQDTFTFWAKYGMTIIFVFTIVAAVSLYFIKIPETIDAQIIVTSRNPPIELISKVSGKIVSKYVEDKQSVKRSERLLQLESLTNIEDLKGLEEIILGTRPVIASDFRVPIKRIDIKQKLNLGDLQIQYESFKKLNNELSERITRKRFDVEKSVVEFRLKSLENLHLNLLEQSRLLKRELFLASENYRLDSLLSKNHTVSQIQLRFAETTKLRAEMAYNVSLQSIINNENDKGEIEEQLIYLERDLEVQKNNFIVSFNSIKAAVDSWRNKYTLLAEIDGIVSFHKTIYEGQFVREGEPILYIVPSTNNMICEAKVQQVNFGKLRKGQRAIIKFDSYNFQEFGVVDAIVSNISDVPTHESRTSEVPVFLVQLELPNNNFITSNNFSMQKRFGLTGKASIILDDRNLLQKLFLDRFANLFVY